MSMVVSVALLTGACAPRAKPVGYVGGTALAIAGAALMADASSTDCTPDEPQLFSPEPLFCGVGVLGEGALGGLAMLTGLTILIVALASSSAPEPSYLNGTSPVPHVPPPPAPEAPEEEPPDWPRAMRPAPPSRSPSAPSGSPLAPAQSQSLSMRSGVRLAFD
jgi:hypothetical protein